MSIFAGAEWYTRHPDDKQHEPPITFDEMPLKDLTALVDEASLSNGQKHAEAIAKADSFSFQRARPEFLPTENNKQLINHWLKTQRIDNPTYPDFEAAYEHYKDSGLLDIDSAEFARDKSVPRTFKGALTDQIYDSVASMIAQERNAALRQVPNVSDAEAALYELPIEQFQALVKQGERAAQHQVNSGESQKNADAWLLLHPEFSDDKRNANLILQQLRANGVTDATMADVELASRQLRDSGLLTLKKKELAKQHTAELQKRADAFKDDLAERDFNEEDAETLSMEELRKRANKQLARGW